jgi:hypothetical protein
VTSSSDAWHGEAFVILEREGRLAPALSQRMQGWAGLRNVLTHLYLEIDHQRVYAVLTEDLDSLEAFARQHCRASSTPRIEQAARVAQDGRLAPPVSRAAARAIPRRARGAHRPPPPAALARIRCMRSSPARS